MIASVFFLVKFFLQYLVGRLISKKGFIKHYVFEKQTYFSYLVLLSLLPLLFLIFTPLATVLLTYVFAILWIVLFLLAMLLVLSHFKVLFFKHSLYFILYLCAFEICPLIGAILFMR